MRTIKVGLPFKGAITIDLLNTTRASGRENRTKIKPVMTASKKTPVMISTVLTM
jgi:hypothetical protein